MDSQKNFVRRLVSLLTVLSAFALSACSTVQPPLPEIPPGLNSPPRPLYRHSEMNKRHQPSPIPLSEPSSKPAAGIM